MSALCLSHSHSAADMEGLVPASTASSTTSSTCTTTASSCNSSAITTTSSSNSSNSSSTLSTGRGEFLAWEGVKLCQSDTYQHQQADAPLVQHFLGSVLFFLFVFLPFQTQETRKCPRPTHPPPPPFCQPVLSLFLNTGCHLTQLFHVVLLCLDAALPERECGSREIKQLCPGLDP